MDVDQFAEALIACLAQHQKRGLVDPGFGFDDVVIHGRIDMLGAAQAMIEHLATGEERRSWSRWFSRDVEKRRCDHRQARQRSMLEGRLSLEPNEVEAALLRMRLRELDATAR